MTTEDPHWIPANDGVRLDATVCLPDGPPPSDGWPVVVLVHGHGENGSKATTLPRGRGLASRGYASVCYSVRGQGGSEGLSFHLGAQELFDLQTVVQWTRDTLPVDGSRVAVAGSSQGGWHSWMAAAHCPGVRTVVPENIFVDFADFAVPDGALSTWFFTRTMRRRVMTAGLQDLARQWAIEGDWERLRAWLQPLSPRIFAHRIRCPVLCVHGWHDVGMPANDLLRMFALLPQPKRLLLGGGGHDGQDAKSAVALRTEMVDRWLARWLLGSNEGDDDSVVTYVERPGWVHHHTPALQPDGAHTLYLRVDNTLSDQAPTAPAANHNVNHVPTDPAYTLATALHRDLAGTRDAWPREEARFEGAPLTSDLTLLGAVQFQLHVLSNRPFFQIHAELHDVAPDGSATLITRGHQGTRTAVPAAHQVVDIEARAIAYRVSAGHHLRVVVADQHPDYVVPVYRPWRARLYCEGARPSCVRLPTSSSTSPGAP
ncbi:MAG: prolyl oligopeptidase family serine peptidase [Myxococcales bacterium]|nr:prolyl oligopeptidase family serine peptidase [Myxococcales bacterium]